MHCRSRGNWSQSQLISGEYVNAGKVRFSKKGTLDQSRDQTQHFLAMRLQHPKYTFPPKKYFIR